jgi:hypothetical protein
MLTQNGIHSNGTAFTPCVSDYEPRPQEGTAPQPKWRDQFPMFTHNVSWVDTDSKQHSLTIRTDDADELFGILKAVKHIVRASKEKAAETTLHATQEPQEEVSAETQPDVMRCAIHGVDMPRRWSKRTNGHYFAHRLPNGDFCYGKVKV